MSLEPGTTISDRYKIVAPLGEGGMGVVYQAEHVYMKKTVALKVLHASFAKDVDVVARFEREAVAAGNIQHPNVATATDFGRLADGTFFLVMEFIEGRSLRVEIDKGPMDPLRALRITRQVVQGVGAAHEKGIIHRDLKPENIMLLGEDGEHVKVLDFGIAKMESVALADAGKILTQTGQVFGTPDYMAPEQAMGERIDKRADFYALGVILYEMLAGTRPFKGGTMTLLRDRVFLETPPDLPPELTVDGEIRALVKKLMARLVQDRFASAEEVLDALDAASLERSPTIAPPVTGSAATPTPTMVAQTGGHATPSPGAASLALIMPAWRTTVTRFQALPFHVRVGAGAAAALLVVLLFSMIFGSSDADTAAGGSSEAHPDPKPSASHAAKSFPKPSAVPSAEVAESGGRVDTATSSDAKTSGDGKKATRKGRSTGPGGIYIPPPDQWFQ